MQERGLLSAQRRPLLFGIITLAAILSGIVLSLWLDSNSPTQRNAATAISATVIPSPRAIQPFSMVDHLGRPFTQESLLGNWTLLNFGYTSCPDICPTTLMTLARFDQEVKRRSADRIPQVVFVTIDPQRDNQEQLAAYVPYFNQSFLGVNGDADNLRRLTSQLGILYLRVEKERADDDYLMDHSSSIILSDPQGRYRAVFSAPHDAVRMASDFLAISGSDDGNRRSLR